MRQPVLVSVLLLAFTLVAGCTTGSASEPDEGPGAPASSVPSAQDRSRPEQPERSKETREDRSEDERDVRTDLAPGSAGAGGLTVRHLDRDGKVKTIRVEDFRR